MKCKIKNHCIKSHQSVNRIALKIKPKACINSLRACTTTRGTLVQL